MNLNGKAKIKFALNEPKLMEKGGLGNRENDNLMRYTIYQRKDRIQKSYLELIMKLFLLLMLLQN